MSDLYYENSVRGEFYREIFGVCGVRFARVYRDVTIRCGRSHITKND